MSHSQHDSPAASLDMPQLVSTILVSTLTSPQGVIAVSRCKCALILSARAPCQASYMAWWASWRQTPVHLSSHCMPRRWQTPPSSMSPLVVPAFAGGLSVEVYVSPLRGALVHGPGRLAFWDSCRLYWHVLAFSSALSSPMLACQWVHGILVYSWSPWLLLVLAWSFSVNSWTPWNRLARDLVGISRALVDLGWAEVGHWDWKVASGEGCHKPGSFCRHKIVCKFGQTAFAHQNINCWHK